MACWCAGRTVVSSSATRRSSRVSTLTSDDDDRASARRALRRVAQVRRDLRREGQVRALSRSREVVENVVQGLADNLVAHGRMYCPCAPVEESKAKGSDMVCPCKPHHADIARQGYCDCALFASRDFVAAENLRRAGGSGKE